MNFDAIIDQLRHYAPCFRCSVAGAADFEKAVVDQAWLPLPAAYVRPLDEDAEPNTLLNSLNQLVTERVGIIVVFDNSTDRRGQTVASTYDAVRASIFSAVLNWRLDPVRAARGLEYAGGQLLSQDRARLIYQWTFSQQITIGARDGWQVPTEPLLLIDATLETPSGHLLAEAAVSLPQS